MREAGSWKLETGNWKLEAGNWKLEAGNWKLEAGSWKLEAGDCTNRFTSGAYPGRAVRAGHLRGTRHPLQQYPARRRAAHRSVRDTWRRADRAIGKETGRCAVKQGPKYLYAGNGSKTSSCIMSAV